jgi:predicted unusual protein kinase regulating ubiquinone biosynthesis (AarF/ABC1/UbiB family)
VKDLRFPKFFPALSSKKVLTMEYLDGQPLDQFAQSASLEDKQRIGQKLWDIFDEQIRFHHHVHADPHPGNFLVGTNGELQMLDFGCTKEIPDSFHLPFFKMMEPSVHDNPQAFRELLFELDMLQSIDTPQQIEFFMETYRCFVKLLGKPFYAERFDFADRAYFKSITDLSQELQASDIYKKSKRGRGSKHGLYVNRTYFGLYNLLHMLSVEINTGMEVKKHQKEAI